MTNPITDLPLLNSVVELRFDRPSSVLNRVLAVLSLLIAVFVFGTIANVQLSAPLFALAAVLCGTWAFVSRDSFQGNRVRLGADGVSVLIGSRHAAFVPWIEVRGVEHIGKLVRLLKTDGGVVVLGERRQSIDMSPFARCFGQGGSLQEWVAHAVSLCDPPNAKRFNASGYRGSQDQPTLDTICDRTRPLRVRVAAVCRVPVTLETAPVLRRVAEESVAPELLEAIGDRLAFSRSGHL